MDIDLLGRLGKVFSPLMAAIATFALKAGLWFRRGRLVMVARRFSAIFLPISSGFTTQRPCSDFPSHLSLPRLSKLTKDGAQTRRVLALAAIYDGGSRTDAARTADVGLQTVRDWVLRFNTRGPAGLIDGKAPGNASKLN
jgi:hypothetical protein